MHQRRQGLDLFLSQHFLRSQQDTGDQQPQILVEMPAHPAELGLIDGARRLQPAGQLRQPAVAARQHLGNELHQFSPALIIQLEHAIDGEPEPINAFVRQRAARRLFVNRLGRVSDSMRSADPAPAVIGNWFASQEL